MNKYFIYCRKSSEQEDRQILSLPAQEKELKALAEKENLEVVDIYSESMSAKWAGRPKFNEMIKRIEKREADGLIVWDESRIARNARDSGDVIYKIDLGEIKEIRKPGKTYINTPDDKSWLAMCFMMSKKESDDKGVNVARGLRQKAENGWFPSSWTKPGYIWDRWAERGNKTLLKDRARFNLIKQCFELMLSGTYTVAKILEKLNDEWHYRGPIRKTMGGKPMARSELYRIFTDTFYYGDYQYPDKDGHLIWHTGKHKPMITKDDFDKIQLLLGRNGRPRPKTHDFFGTGLIQCGECGGAVTAEEKWQIICSSCKFKFSSQNKTSCPKCEISIEEMIKPKLLHYIYYHCAKSKNPNCKQKSITAVELGNQFENLLSNIQISEKFKDWAIKYLNELNDTEVVNRNAIVGSLQEGYSDCVKRLDNLLKLKISPNNSDGSLLSDIEFKQQKESLLKEKGDIASRLGTADNRINNWLEQSEQAFEFACYARERFKNDDNQTKKDICFRIGSNLTLKDKILRIDIEKPLTFIEKAKNEVMEISPRFEPKEKTIGKIQMAEFYTSKLTLLPNVSALRTYFLETEETYEPVFL